MITGIGLDLIEIERVLSIDQRSDKFRRRILTPYELAKYGVLSDNRKIEYLAGRFAAKEAFAKALGTGLGHACSFQDIEIRSSDTGMPIIYFKHKKKNGFVSITHTKSMAAAQVILLQEE